MRPPPLLSAEGQSSIAPSASSTGAITPSQSIPLVNHILHYHPAVMKLKATIHPIYSNRLNIGRLRIEKDALRSLAWHDISVTLGLVEGD